MSRLDLDYLKSIGLDPCAFALPEAKGRLAGRTHGVRAGTAADLVCPSDGWSPQLAVPEEAGETDADQIAEIQEVIVRARAAREPARLLDLRLRQTPLSSIEREELESLQSKGDKLTPAQRTRLKFYLIRAAGEKYAAKHGTPLTPKMVTELAAIEVRIKAVESAQERVLELLQGSKMPIPTNKSMTTWLSGGAMSVQNSGNEKITSEGGDEGVRNTSTTYAAINPSCPTTCVQRGVSCYAETSNNIRPIVLMLEYLANKLGHGSIEVAEDEARALDASFPLAASDDPAARKQASGIKTPTDLRIHTVGDCREPMAVRTLAAAAERWLGRSTWVQNPKYHELAQKTPPKAWSYTHAFADHTRSDWGSVSVLASVSSPADLPKAARHGFALTCVVGGDYYGTTSRGADKKLKDALKQKRKLPVLQEGVDYKNAYRFDPKCNAVVPFYTPEGAPIPFKLQGTGETLWIPCPAQNPNPEKRWGCVSCRICFDDEGLRKRNMGVAFHAHASGKVRGVPFKTAEFEVDYSVAMEARRAGQETKDIRSGKRLSEAEWRRQQELATKRTLSTGASSGRRSAKGHLDTIEALYQAAQKAGDTRTVNLVRAARMGNGGARSEVNRLLESDWWAHGGYEGP